MTKIKLCGLRRQADIEAANRLHPEYIGFVFAEKSRRYVSPQDAKALKAMLLPDISAVGVFVNAPVETVAKLLQEGVIDAAQLHGQEDDAYVHTLRQMTHKPILQAFRIDNPSDVKKATESAADYILLDSGNGGTGTAFDWSLLQQIERPYFLAGGLHPNNVKEAIRTTHPFAVDVSSGIETDGWKDIEKMRAFVCAVRGKEDLL